MPSIDINFLNLLKDDFKKFPIFIETGTYRGETTFNCEPFFDEIYTIEIKENIFNETKNKYTGKKINFLLGDSSEVFKDILPTIHLPAVFFLDGHYSVGETGCGNKDCPLIEEIQHIYSLFNEEAIIIIDDHRLFGKGPKTNDEVVDWNDISNTSLLALLKERISLVYFLDSELESNDRMIIHITKKSM